MRLDKVILRAVLSTLAAIALLLLITVLSCVFFFPSTLMYLSYDLGMERSAVRYAERAYKLDGGAESIALAFEVSLDREDYVKVEKYGKKFLADDEFEKYCLQQDIKNSGNEYLIGSYAQFVYGNTCAAIYRNGKTEEALAASFSSTETEFSQGNASVRILLAALQNGDTQTATLIREDMLEKRANDAFAADFDYLDEMIALATRYIDGE